MRKIGILGGTFDPIHLAHIALGELAKDSYSLDMVLFIPTGESYFKTRVGRKVTPAEDRLAMVELALKGHDGLEASDIEIRRTGHTYTVDTLEELSALYPDARFYFITGADALASMETWYMPDRIFSLASVIVAEREDQVTDGELDATISRLTERFGAIILRLKNKNMDISSSEIREYIANGTRPAEALPDEVYDYILNHGLYKDARLPADQLIYLKPSTSTTV